MVDNWLSGTYERMLNKYVPKVAGDIPYAKQQRFIYYGLKSYNFILMILKAIFYVWLFQKSYKHLGFEQTAILLLTIIMIVLKNKR